MNPPSLYRQTGRSGFWIAFISALAIHLGAVALAKTKSPAIKISDFNSPGEVELVATAAEPEPALLEESAMPPPLEQVHAEQDSFPEENVTPPRLGAHRKARQASVVRGPTAPLRSVKAMVAYAPRPIYPYEARRQRMTGSGIALLTVDQTSGTVTDVRMAQSCGNVILDKSTLDALQRWRFRPGGVTRVEVPITYTLMGVSY